MALTKVGHTASAQRLSERQHAEMRRIRLVDNVAQRHHQKVPRPAVTAAAATTATARAKGHICARPHGERRVAGEGRAQLEDCRRVRVRGGLERRASSSSNLALSVA